MPAYVGTIDGDGLYSVRSVWYDGNPAALLPSLHHVWRSLGGDWNATIAALHKRDWSCLVPYDLAEQRGAGSPWVHVPNIGRGYPDDEIHPHPRRGNVKEAVAGPGWLYVVQLPEKIMGVYGAYDSGWRLASKFADRHWRSFCHADAVQLEAESPMLGHMR